MPNDEKTIENAELDSGHCEEVHRRNGFPVIPQEGEPTATPINCACFALLRDWLSRFTNKRNAPALPSGNWRENERAGSRLSIGPVKFGCQLLELL
jgi:hypothetical protein